MMVMMAFAPRDVGRVLTKRLEVRHPVERDRQRFIDLFCDRDFMVYSGGPLSRQRANARFDHMSALCRQIPFAKQPVVERSSNIVIGYTGVDEFELDGQLWLEWGYRLIDGARGHGYATEASRALLAAHSHESLDRVIAIIHPDNEASHHVIRKLAFHHWRRAIVGGEERDVYKMRL